MNADSTQFVAPHPLRTCVQILHSKQRLPQRGSFGLWVDESSAAKETSTTVRCTLVYRMGRLQRAAAIDAELAARPDGSTDVVLRSIEANPIAGGGFVALGVLGIVVMLATNTNPVAKAIFVIVFLGLAAFGAYYNRALLGISRRLPDLIREWLGGE